MIKKKGQKSKNESIAKTAHQLRSPLAFAKWTVKMLLSGSFGKITDEQKKAIQKLYNSNEKMIKLVNGLSDDSQN